MAKFDLRQKAFLLREKGMPYSEIKTLLGVSKSTLSVWLREYPLSQERINELRGNSAKRIERFRQTMYEKRKSVINDNISLQKKILNKVSSRELYIIGLVLYWAEGTKTWDSRTELTNSDPTLLKVFVRWLKQEGADLARIKIKLHLYDSMNEDQMVSFWSKTLDIPKKQFYKPIIKNSKRANHRGLHGKGTCQLIYGNRQLNNRIFAGVTYLSSLFS